MGVNIIEVIEETVRKEIGHMTDVEAGIDMVEEGIAGIEETVDLGIEVD